jgi:acetoin utilization protein AcuB
MARTTPTVADFMTRSPHSIGMNQSLEEAHRLMRDYRIRHLPVLDGGELVGLVSERDLHLLETFRDVNAAKVTVEEAMTSDPYVVPPNTPLTQVALEMWKNKYGSAVVMEGDRLAGVFTTIDALGALATIIVRSQRKPAARKPAAKKKPAPKKAPAKRPAKKPTAKKPAKKSATKRRAR